jgi:hypothetical protein
MFEAIRSQKPYIVGPFLHSYGFSITGMLKKQKMTGN